MLVDDDEPTNFLHQMLIEEADCAHETVVKTSAQDALSFIKHSESKKCTAPNWIFLDINMPGMNGWEFLMEYEKLPSTKKENSVLIMLTTSLNPDDEEHAKHIFSVKEFRKKPLTTKMLDSILDTYFNGECVSSLASKKRDHPHEFHE